MTTDSIRPAAAGKLRSSLVPTTVIVCLALFTASMVGFCVWSKHVAEETLKGPAIGAESLYYDTNHSFYTLGRLAVEVQNTRSPGSYLRAVTQWSEAINPPSNRGSAKWVIELRAKQRDQALGWLSNHKVSASQVSELQSKLQKISPQMSDSETTALDDLTSFGGMMDLAKIQADTSKSLFSKLHDMGARDTGLVQVGLRNWTADLDE